MKASKTSTAPRRTDEEQYLTAECVCGRKLGVYLRHYEIVRCACGSFWWALQPGPRVMERIAGSDAVIWRAELALRPWPGLYNQVAA